MKLFNKSVVFKKSAEGSEETAPEILSDPYTAEQPPAHPLVEKLKNADDRVSIMDVFKEYASSDQHKRDIPDFQSQCMEKVRSLSVAPPNVASLNVTSPNVTRRVLDAPYIGESSGPRPLSGPETTILRTDYDSKDPNHIHAPHGNVQEQRTRKAQGDALAKIFDSGYLKQDAAHPVDTLLAHQHSHDKPHGVNDNINGILGSFNHDGQKLTRDNIFDWVETLTENREIKTNPEILYILANHADYRAKLKAIIDKSPELRTAIEALVKPSGEDLRRLLSVSAGADVTDEEKTLLDTMNNPVIARARQVKGENKPLFYRDYIGDPSSIYDDIDTSSAPEYDPDIPDPTDGGHGVDTYDPYGLDEPEIDEPKRDE